MESSFFSSSSKPSPAVGALIHDKQGVHATIKEIQKREEGGPMMVVLTEEGSEWLLPMELVDQKEGNFCVGIAFADLRTGAKSEENPSFSSSTPAHSIPVWEEVINVEKKRVDTGKGVRIGKKVKERQENVAVTLFQDEIKVERVPINKILASDEVPLPRQEGDTYIVPVFKEVLVIEKKLCLQEEVHITTNKKQVESSQPVSLRSEEISIQHFDEDAS